MQLYQFIIPSDTITFYAADDKVAYACTLFIGDGKAGCKRFSGNIEIMLHTLVAHYADAEEIITQNLGEPLLTYWESHKEEISQALRSFAYVKPAEREAYDNECNRRTSLESLDAFKREHENKQRITFQPFVLRAWKASEVLILIPQEIAA